MSREGKRCAQALSKLSRITHHASTRIASLLPSTRVLCDLRTFRCAWQPTLAPDLRGTRLHTKCPPNRTVMVHLTSESNLNQRSYEARDRNDVVARRLGQDGAAPTSDQGHPFTATDKPSRETLRHDAIGRRIEAHGLIFRHLNHRRSAGPGPHGGFVQWYCSAAAMHKQKKKGTVHIPQPPASCSVISPVL